ncbi:hypothetical protein [Kistimonas asteriae]|uniref:hypothetical protein n=1 Tax=Kistimonas asteriae TaxID=517724 RepID=UPI001BA7F8BE|nr:hypothetical protein [Kistimonas asteriae]
MVAYRYLQSRQGAYSAGTETTLYALLSAFLGYILYGAIQENDPRLSALSGLIMIIAAGYLTVDYRNTRRYQEINAHALEYLKHNFTQRLLKKIKRLEYDQQGIKQLCRTLSTADISTSELINHLRSKNPRSHIA